jgi:hypothetical protein
MLMAREPLKSVDIKPQPDLNKSAGGPGSPVDFPNPPVAPGNAGAPPPKVYPTNGNPLDK